MNFEEQFPDFVKECNKDYLTTPKEIIMKTCLSKQRVKELIRSQMNHLPQADPDYEYNINMNNALYYILKELGLEE